MNNPILKIKDARNDYIEKTNKRPETIAINYDDGFKLLEQTVDSMNDSDNKIKNMLMKGDRKEIMNYINSGVEVFGIKLTVVDVVVS